MRFAEFTPYDIILLAQGLGVTVALFLVTTLIGLVIGAGLAILRYYRVPGLVQLITFVTEILKNSPVLVQLFLVFFGLLLQSCASTSNVVPFRSSARTTTCSGRSTSPYTSGIDRHPSSLFVFFPSATTISGLMITMGF